MRKTSGTHNLVLDLVVWDHGEDSVLFLVEAIMLGPSGAKCLCEERERERKREVRGWCKQEGRGLWMVSGTEAIHSS